MDGIHAHACVLDPADIDEVKGIPCTSLARTLVDLAGVVSEQRLRAAYREAEKLEKLDLIELRTAMGRVARPRGISKLWRVIAEFNPDSLWAEGDTEIRLLDICTAHELPAPQVNVPVEVEGHSYRPDLMWPRERLIVEGDGRATHSSPRDRHLDLEREQRLGRAGYFIRRFTWHQVTYEPELVAGTIRLLLAERGPAAERRPAASAASAGRAPSPAARASSR